MMNNQTEAPLIIHVQTENTGFITSVILTEVNYDVWSQIMEMQIAGREKLEYIMGKTQPPPPKIQMHFMQNGMLKIKRLRDGC
jgi:hypothetical protein